MSGSLFVAPQNRDDEEAVLRAVFASRGPQREAVGEHPIVPRLASVVGGGW